MSHFISTTIPYVNGAPHIGHAQEFVLADALRRYCGDVYFQSGADENSLKNVLAAEAAGVDTATYVAARSDDFEHLTKALGLALTDFIRTSSDPRTGRLSRGFGVNASATATSIRRNTVGFIASVANSSTPPVSCKTADARSITSSQRSSLRRTTSFD